MNTPPKVSNDNKTLAPDDSEESKFLDAIQDAEKRHQIILILKHAGLIP